MLVGQAAASFAIWNGVAPQVELVLAAPRRQLRAALRIKRVRSLLRCRNTHRLR